jgi:hypothetical protein
LAHLPRVSISGASPRLDRQFKRTERLMRYEFLIQKMNDVIVPRAADESGTG